MTVIRTPIASREAWLEMRRENLGASDIAALFDCHPFKTPFGLYAEKSGLAPAEAPSAQILKRGLLLETAAADAVRMERPDWRISKCTDYLHEPEWRLGATPDFIVFCPKRDSVGVLQTKVIAKPEFDKHWQDGPPLGYVLQNATELMLDSTERDEPKAWGALGALVLGAYTLDCHVYEFERNAAAELRILAAAKQFWASVERGEPPAADYARDGAIIKALNRTGGGEDRDLTRHNRIAMLCEEKLAWMKRRANAEGALDTIDAEITDILGDADRGIHPVFNITRKEQWTGGTVIPRQKSRVLRVTRKKQPQASEHAA